MDLIRDVNETLARPQSAAIDFKRESSMASPVVYLVDDEPVCRQAMQAVLIALGYDCLAFEDGESLIEGLETGKVGVIVADFRLPRMNGLQLFEKVRQSGCQLPFILVSGHADFELADATLQAGVSAFLPKPIPFDELQPLIDDLISKANSIADA